MLAQIKRTRFWWAHPSITLKVFLTINICMNMYSIMGDHSNNNRLEPRPTYWA